MIAAVVLAAGGSTRLGRPKALVRHRGRTLLQRTVDAALASGCSPVLVVLGAAAGEVGETIADRPVERLVHPGWEAGLASSLATGVGALAARPEVRGALLLCCDQPRLSAALLRRMLAAFDGTPGRMVACAYADTIGIPALFERECFKALAALRGERGAKSLLTAAGSRPVLIDWPDGAADVDREEDLGGLDAGS